MNDLHLLQTRKWPFFIAVFLLIAVGALYYQVGSHAFINFDDPEYVYANPFVQKGLSLENIRWAFTTTDAANWHPVTWLCHMLVVQFFGLNPAAHHFANVLLHAANAALLFFLFNMLTGKLWQSAAVAALFAFHPLHVESVAWVAELKDVSSTFFGLLAMLLYLWFIKQPGLLRYFSALMCFSLGLMAKPMLVTLPILLLLLDYWPLRRFERVRFKVLVLEKIPFCLLAAVSCALTIYAQQKGDAVRSLADSPLLARIGNAFVAYLVYLGKTFWPFDLAVLYPFPADIPLWKPLLAALSLGTATCLIILHRKRHPEIFVGWFWYLCTLIPVIGIVRVGQQALADRYTYLPLIGIFMAIVLGVDRIVKPMRGKSVTWITIVAILLCAIITSRQLSHWQNDISLYRHTLAVTRDNFTIHNNLGFALDKEGKLVEAEQHYAEALRIAPWYARAQLNMAVNLRKQGRLDDALSFAREAIGLRADLAAAYIEMGVNTLLKGSPAEAIVYFQDAIKRDPQLADGYYNMGLAYVDLKKPREAVEQFSKAAMLKPEDPDCHYYLGVELVKQGRHTEAIEHFATVMRLKPDRELEQMTRQALERALQEKTAGEIEAL